ncbi:hypothetical protein [Arthrobacter sp. JSM 101049]|uniref:hypothetical protein n=1 Tax=Arthrobacter sp. JSM 101049 TaxID=929097 RepID=UPI00356136A9
MQHDKAPGRACPVAGASVIDYAATARRLGWGELPAAVRARVAGWTGGRVGSVQLAGGGFTHGFAALVDGPRPLFAKAIALDDPHIAAAYAREVEVLAALPASAPIPALLEHEVVAGWQVLATVPVTGRMPGAPWTVEDARAVHDSCRMSNTVLEAAGPAVVPVAGTMAADWAGFLAGLEGGLEGGLESGADGGGPLTDHGRRPAFLPGWFRGGAGDVLARWILDAASRAPTALAGTTPLNNDLRADNVVIAHAALGGFDAGTAWICDWNFLALGPGWADWVALWPALYDAGLPVAEFTSWELAAGAQEADVDAWLSVLFLYYVQAGSRPPVPTSPELRPHQRLCARQALALLAVRSGC